VPVNTDAAYVEIIHLSDLHFGDGHVFTPEPTPDKRQASSLGMPTLADKLLEDLKDESRSPFPTPKLRPRFEAHGAPPSGSPLPEFVYPDFPRILCLSGDFTQKAALEEFQQAESLIVKLQEDPALRIQRDGVFVCPGNHDLAWAKTEDSVRWDQYAGFLTRLTAKAHFAKDAASFGGLQVCHGARTVVLSLNTEMKVADLDGERSRGDLSPSQLASARDRIEALPTEVKREYIKVAMVHHHPVLLPSSAESGRGYDAISGAEKLLPMLHEHGFHLVLHGHKHYPHTFREDVRSAFKQVADHSLFIVAGGTCGSPELPTPKIATQCYNRVRVHWCAREGTTRVQVATRGLVTHKATGDEFLPDQWSWRTLAIDDRHHVAGRRPDVASAASMRYRPPVDAASDANKARDAEYERTHGHFPVAEVFPAMLPGQTAEVHLRIARHPWPNRAPEHELLEVTWSGGHKWFPSVCVNRSEDPAFRATFAYYGATLMQAELTFVNKTTCLTHIYVPLLTSESARGLPASTAAADNKS
jgi:3',5'-cyclic AMP phosphodiesterase CpdA